MKDKYMWLAWAVKNSVTVICWTALAIYFNKWWVALFATLFLSSVESKTNHYRVCDGCGKHSPSANDYNAAIDKATEAGWLRRLAGDKWEDFCPDCAEKMDMEN